MTLVWRDVVLSCVPGPSQTVQRAEFWGCLASLLGPWVQVHGGCITGLRCWTVLVSSANY